MTEIVPPDGLGTGAASGAGQGPRDSTKTWCRRSRQPSCSGRRCGRARWRLRAASCWRSSTCWRCSRRSSRRIRRRKWTARSTSIRRRRLHWVRADGRFSLRPYVRDMRVTDMSSFTYEEDAARELPVKFFVRGYPYELMGFLPSSRPSLRRRPARSHLSVRQRLVRPRRAVAPAVRRADFADRGAGGYRDLVYAGADARRHRRVLRRVRSTP